MIKTLTSRQWATLKRNAMNVQPAVAKAAVLNKAIEKAMAELEVVKQLIEATETGSRLITGGINSIELIKREVTDLGYNDKGQKMTQTKWVPTDRVTVNEDGTYSFEVPDVEEASEVEPEAGWGPSNVEEA